MSTAKQIAHELNEAYRRIDDMRRRFWEELPLPDEIELADGSGIVARVGQIYLVFPLSGVSEVVRAAALELPPDPSPFLLGVLNYHGVPVPVVDLHKLFLQEDVPLSPDQAFVILDLAGRTAALRIDSMESIIRWRREDLVPPGKVLPFFPAVKAAVMVDDRPVAILDLLELMLRLELELVDEGVV